MLHAATAAPGRVEAMVLVSATPYFPEATRAMMRAAAAAPHTAAERAEMGSRHVHGDAQIEALWALPARFAEDRTDMAFTADRLARIEARTLLVHGERDPLYPVELADELHRGIRGSALWMVPREGHVPIYGDARAEFERLAVAFLSGD
jgi:pimeloyl-ACP methyl ester carboxylesterase